MVVIWSQKTTAFRKLNALWSFLFILYPWIPSWSASAMYANGLGCFFFYQEYPAFSPLCFPGCSLRAQLSLLHLFFAKLNRMRSLFLILSYCIHLDSDQWPEGVLNPRKGTSISSAVRRSTGLNLFFVWFCQNIDITAVGTTHEIDLCDWSFGNYLKPPIIQLSQTVWSVPHLVDLLLSWSIGAISSANQELPLLREWKKYQGRCHVRAASGKLAFFSFLFSLMSVITVFFFFS